MHAIAVGWIEREHLSTLGQPVKPVLVLPFPSKFGFIRREATSSLKNSNACVVGR